MIPIFCEEEGSVSQLVNVKDIVNKNKAQNLCIETLYHHFQKKIIFYCIFSRFNKKYSIDILVILIDI